MLEPASIRAAGMAVVLVLTASGARGDALGLGQRPAVGKTSMELSLQVGHEALAGLVEGVCERSGIIRSGSLPVETWSARYDPEPGRSVQLTYWRPADGSEGTMIVAVTLHGASHRVSTRDGEASGSGTIIFEPSGKGGTFVIDAKTEAGTIITGKIKCEAFTSSSQTRGPSPPA